MPALGGLALGPCTFAFLAPLLGTALTVGATNPALAVALTLAFGIGHCAVIVAAGTSTGLVAALLAWDRRSRGLTTFPAGQRAPRTGGGRAPRLSGVAAEGAGQWL